MLKNKNIVLGVSGGIAAYKAVELLRLLKKAGAAVQVIMTENAAQFVGPMTFEALSEKQVCVNLFKDAGDASISHIRWADEADAVVIAPATANFVGKLAGGIADDALSTFIMAVTTPVLVCPSMNSNMYLSEAVQRNLKTIEKDGFGVLSPGSGELACGIEGPGRLPEPVVIFDRLVKLLKTDDLEGKRVLVTAGPTREPFDPVRFISNPSSGRMGYAIARAAEMRGAEVTLVSGPVEIDAPVNVEVVRTNTVDEMAEEVFARFDNTDIVIKAAAVGDYRPATAAEHKIKKDSETIDFSLVKNQDILRELGSRKKNQVLCGFAAETRDLQENAQKKLKEKNLDMIVANLVNCEGSGFRTTTNSVTLFSPGGKVEPLPNMEKTKLADIILDRIAGL